MSATIPAGITLRPWQEGDDLRLLEIWGDPDTPQQHQDRTLLRESLDPRLAAEVCADPDDGSVTSVTASPATSGQGWSVCLVAEDDGVAVAAGTVATSTVHPQRLWLYVETAREQRGRGIGTAVVTALRKAASLAVSAGHDLSSASSGAVELKARFAVGTGEKAGAEQATEAFLTGSGMAPIQRSRRIAVGPGALALPQMESEADQPAIEDLATGSVELTQTVAAFYEAVHAWDPAQMSVGRAQQLLLADSTGASGAVVLRDRPKAEGGTIQAFAISYTPERTDDPADVLLGWNPQLEEQSATESVRTLLSLLTAQYAVQLEVDDSMSALLAVVEPLVESGHAQVLLDTRIWATDAEPA
ncbi:GNAT family N-acetyltransferase [Micrococcus terreus]|uniref:N-acetyltransferase domain-containing protein n=1 Tax=Micrococcus terreus TaxID=574650 RepID=A0A1I7MSE1_9MICC|nr:GNAT family N-acetyltransferase [Micrococcus terreus]SFV24842.1 hypothetical protein SAMN04487966_11431 [Micrococcus terreus]